MNNKFAYAKPPIYHYQTYDLKSLQFTNHPIIAPRPRAPSFAKQDGEDEEGETQGDESQGAANEEGQAAAAEEVAVEEGTENDAGLFF